MEGDLSNKDEYGVIPRSASAIFNELQSNPDYISSSVYCSLLEIYNEELSDLLVTSSSASAASTTSNGSSTRGGGGGVGNGASTKVKTTTTTKLAIMEGENGPFCRGLSETKVTCAEELLVLMQRAHEQRHTGETDMNKESSRSHCIFTLRIESKRKLIDGSILEIGGKLHCVDLAGSECAKSCGNAGPQQATRERERMNINRSLLTLGRVVKLLKDAAATGSGKSSSSSVRIPYRDSKLTRILQESLGGRCKTCLIATISPSITAIEESMSTLNYAQAANGIINKPITTSLMSVGGFDNKHSPSTGQGDSSSASGGGGGGGQSVEHWHEMECRLEYMQSQVDESQQALARKHIQHQEFVERAKEAELAKQILERNYQQSIHDQKQLEIKVNTISQQLDVTENTLHETKLVLDATQHTEICLTTEATTLIDAVKRSISDGDTIYQDLIQKQKEDITRKVAIKEYHTNQMNRLNDLLTVHLQSISKLQSDHRRNITNTSTNYNSNQIELLNNHTSIIERIKNESIFELNVLQKVIDNGIVPSVVNLTKTSTQKLNILKDVLKDGDTTIQSCCESIIERLLVDNINHIKNMETSYGISSNNVIQNLDGHLHESKTNLTKIVSDMTQTIERLNIDRMQQRNNLKSIIHNYKTNHHNGSMNEIHKLSNEHALFVHESIQSTKNSEEKSRTKILDSITSLNGFLLTKNDEYIEKLESQYETLTKQHEALEISHEQQQEMNKSMVSNVMVGMQSLIENEMKSMGVFQSNNFNALIASNDKSKAYNANVNQTTVDTYQHSTSTNKKLSNDVRDNFVRQESACQILENHTTEFDTHMKTVIANHCDTTDTFVKESMNTVQDNEKIDDDATQLMISSLNTQIDIETTKLVTGINEEVKEGILDLQKSNKVGWDYVRNEVIDTIQDDVTNKIQSLHNQVSIRAIDDINTINTVLNNGEETTINEINKGHETVLAVEKGLDVGLSENFTSSINKHKETIENSTWLEESIHNHEKLIIDEVSKSCEIVSSCTEQLDHLTNDIVPVHEETPEIKDRDVPIFTEELTSTKDHQVILSEAAAAGIDSCSDDDGRPDGGGGGGTCTDAADTDENIVSKENHYQDDGVAMVDDTELAANDHKASAMKKKTTTTTQTGIQAPSSKLSTFKLKDRSINKKEPSSSSSPSSISCSSSKRRDCVDKKGNNNNNGQKRSKRAKVARQK